jgi:hypothetical protein
MSDVPADSYKQHHFDNGISVRVEPIPDYNETKLVLSGPWDEYMTLDMSKTLLVGPGGRFGFWHFGDVDVQAGTFTFRVWNDRVNRTLDYLSRLRLY